jgi:hypothetical protein
MNFLLNWEGEIQSSRQIRDLVKRFLAPDEIENVFFQTDSTLAFWIDPMLKDFMF